MKKRKAPDDGTAERGSGGGGVDRLSGLPDDLIGRILSFLPTPQAFVLTAQLSRRWRRAWAHVAALNLSVRDCVRRSGVNNNNHGPFRAMATAALARFPTAGIPAVSVEVDHHACLADEWFARAMARAVGSVRVTSQLSLSFLGLPPCTRAEALHVAAPRTRLDLPDPDPDPDPGAAAFGRLAELSLALLQLGERPRLDEFLASCCPRLRTLRLRRVRGQGQGHALRRLALRSGALEVLDLDTVDGLETLDVAADRLRCLSVRSCFFRGGEVTVSAPRIDALCWYRSYPERLTFRDDAGLAHVRRLAGPLKLPTLGRPDQLDAAYTTRLLRSCALAVHRLDVELVVPDEMALRNWQQPGDVGAPADPEDLIRHVPALPCVGVLSLKIRWGLAGGVAPCLASFLSRTPSLTTLRVHASPYCLTVYEGQEAALPARGKQQWKQRSDVVGADGVRLDGLREMSLDGLKGTDSEEHGLVQLLLASAPPSLERLSLTFHDAAASSIVDEIAAEIPVHFPMATGRWDYRCTASVLTWTRVECMGDDRTARAPTVLTDPDAHTGARTAWNSLAWCHTIARDEPCMPGLEETG